MLAAFVTSAGSRRMRTWIGGLLAAVLPWAYAPAAGAQSTDGFHEIQVFPVVVDSTSFTQRFSFRASSFDGSPAVLSPRYFPAQGTTQGTPIDCPSFEVPFGGKTFDGLRAVCPSLAGGSQYGFLAIEQTSAKPIAFSGFSRVSNPQGAGFTVEAVPTHDFTAAFSTAAGLRRTAASAGAPAFQTNCFIGLVGEHGAVAQTTRVLVGLLDENGEQLGDALSYYLLPGQMVRLLDVFSTVGAPPGDHDRATLVARQVMMDGDPRPGILSFCTVQDNTSFGADFRIAKQERGLFSNGVPFGPGAYDGNAMRVSLTYANPGTAGSSPFDLAVGSGQQNTHVFYFRHPDWISCELVGGPGNVTRLVPENGLEMRLLAWSPADGWTPIAGGTGMVAWDRLYLGDKRQRDEGFNTEYLLQVEDNAAMGVLGTVGYGLRCWSGSGHTRGEMILYHRAANDF
jgi:hypothetical protein